MAEEKDLTSPPLMDTSKITMQNKPLRGKKKTRITRKVLLQLKT